MAFTPSAYKPVVYSDTFLAGAQVSDQTSSTTTRRLTRSSIQAGFIGGVIALVIAASTGMSWTLGLLLVLAGMFGPWLVIRRGAGADGQSLRFPWRNVAVVLVILGGALQYVDRDFTIATARSGLKSQLQDSSATGWEVRSASAPFLTLLNGSNEVQFVLTKDDSVRRFSVTVHGTCLAGCIATWNKLQSFGM